MRLNLFLVILILIVTGISRLGNSDYDFEGTSSLDNSDSNCDGTSRSGNSDSDHFIELANWL